MRWNQHLLDYIKTIWMDKRCVVEGLYKGNVQKWKAVENGSSGVEKLISVISEEEGTSVQKNQNMEYTPGIDSQSNSKPDEVPESSDTNRM